MVALITLNLLAVDLILIGFIVGRVYERNTMATPKWPKVKVNKDGSVAKTRVKCGQELVSQGPAGSEAALREDLRLRARAHETVCNRCLSLHR